MPDMTEQELDLRLSTIGLPTHGTLEEKQKLWDKHSNVTFEAPQAAETKVEHPNAVKVLASTQNKTFGKKGKK